MAFIQMNLLSKSLMRTVPVNVILPVDKMVPPGMPERGKALSDALPASRHPGELHRLSVRNPYSALYCRPVRRVPYGGNGRPCQGILCGDGDGLLAANRDMVAFLREQGADVTFETGPGGHERDFWDAYIKTIGLAALSPCNSPAL